MFRKNIGFGYRHFGLLSKQANSNLVNAKLGLAASGRAKYPRFYSTGIASRFTNFQRGVAIGLGVGIVGSTLYYTNDTIYHNLRHVYFAAERVGVVTVTTVRCFSLYRKFLTTEYNTPEEKHDALRDIHLKAAKITLKALEKNGGIYIKLGQHISVLTYLLPPEWTTTMTPLQDRCPRSSMEEIEKMFRRDLGCSIDDIFSEFNPNPVGVASLAQVHIATIKSTGQKCAIKIQHPSLQEFVPIDIYMTQTVFGLIHKVFPEYPLTWLGDELQSSIYVELDFVNEAENAERTAQYFLQFEHETALRIPKIISANKRIMIMEYLAGSRLDDLDYIRKHNILPEQVSSCLAHIFNNMIFTPGVGLHCDPHGGNLAIRAIENSKGTRGHNFEIILYDHGLYRQIPYDMKVNYSHFWLSIMDSNVEDMKLYFSKVTGINNDAKFKIFMSAITGRDIDNALNFDISSSRSKEEVERIQGYFEKDPKTLEELMELLLLMPRVVLMILKTNDLTRNLDECLESPLGPERAFLIMANYCAKVVYDEQREINNTLYNRFSVGMALATLRNWWHYHKRTSQMYLYDWFMVIRRLKSTFLY